MLDRFPLFSPLADSPNVDMSHGGSFNLTFRNIPDDNDNPTLKKIKVYNLLFHMLRAVSNDKLDNPPLNSKAAHEYIGRAEVIHQKLCNNRQLIRGLKIKTTYTALSLAQAF